MYVRSGSLCMQSSVYCALNIGCSLTIDTAFSFSFFALPYSISSYCNQDTAFLFLLFFTDSLRMAVKYSKTPEKFFIEVNGKK